MAVMPANVAASGLKTKARVNSWSATVGLTGTVRPDSSVVTSFVVVMGNPGPMWEQSCIAFQPPLPDLHRCQQVNRQK